MLGVLASIFMLVVRTAFAFINGYLIASVVIIISPLILPLVFMNVTRTYFDGLYRNFMAAFIMPVIVCAYAMFALIIYDKMLFAPDSMVQKIFKYDEIKDALQDPKKLCDRQVTGNSAERLPNPADTPALNKMFKDYAGFINNTANPGLSGANDLCATFRVPNRNMNDMKSPEFKKGKETYEKLFNELMGLFILGYLLHVGLAAVQGFVLNIAGARATNAGTGQLPGEERFRKATDEARANMIGTMRQPGTNESRGAEMLQRIVPTARAGVQGTFNGITKG
jgi:type IV secretory pathway VirB6-like protein